MFIRGNVQHNAEVMRKAAWNQFQFEGFWILPFPSGSFLQSEEKLSDERIKELRDEYERNDADPNYINWLG